MAACAHAATSSAPLIASRRGAVKLPEKATQSRSFERRCSANGRGPTSPTWSTLTEWRSTAPSREPVAVRRLGGRLQGEHGLPLQQAKPSQKTRPRTPPRDCPRPPGVGAAPPSNRRGAAEECLITRAPYHGATAWTRRTERRFCRYWGGGRTFSNWGRSLETVTQRCPNRCRNSDEPAGRASEPLRSTEPRDVSNGLVR
jgi:hypothetical protein